MRELGPLGARGIALSGHVAREDRDASRAAGFADHLGKPVLFSNLFDALGRLVQ